MDIIEPKPKRIRIRNRKPSVPRPPKVPRPKEPRAPRPLKPRRRVTIGQRNRVTIAGFLHYLPRDFDRKLIDEDCAYFRARGADDALIEEFLAAVETMRARDSGRPVSALLIPIVVEPPVVIPDGHKRCNMCPKIKPIESFIGRVGANHSRAFAGKIIGACFECREIARLKREESSKRYKPETTQR
jgi:hypothetical protein